MRILTVINTMFIAFIAGSMMAVLVHGVGGTCDVKSDKIQDRLTTWHETGQVTVQQPLDPIQE